MMKTFKLNSILVIILLGSCLFGSIPTGMEYKKIKKQLPRTSRSMFKQANTYLKKDQYIHAKKLYDGMIKRQKNFYAYWGYAWSEWQLDNNKNARALFYKAFNINDSLYSFLNNYAEFTRQIETDWSIIRRIANAMYRCKNNDDALLLILDHVVEPSDESEALEFFKELREAYPDNPNINVYYAILLCDIGKSKDAVTLAQSVIDIAADPFHLKMIERILANNGYFIDAARACDNLGRLAKKSAYTYDAWGHLEFKQGHYENAVIYYQKALHFDYSKQILMTLARLYHFYLNDSRKAIYYSKAALQIDRSIADAYFILAESARKSGNLDKAFHYSTSQLELLPDHPHPHYYHGKLLYEKKLYREAIPYLEKAVAISPDVQRYRLVLAKCYGGAGLLKKASQTYKNFLNEPLKDLWTEEEMLREDPPEPK